MSARYLETIYGSSCWPICHGPKCLLNVIVWLFSSYLATFSNYLCIKFACIMRQWLSVCFSETRWTH